MSTRGEAGGGDSQPAAMEFESTNLEAERRRHGRLNSHILAVRAVVPNNNMVHILGSSWRCFSFHSS